MRPIVFDQLADQDLVVTMGQPGHGLGQRQADDATGLGRARGIEPTTGKGGGHMLRDQRLRVDQRAIHVEDDEFHAPSSGSPLTS